MSDIGSEMDGQGRNCRVKKVIQLCMYVSKLVNNYFNSTLLLRDWFFGEFSKEH